GRSSARAGPYPRLHRPRRAPKRAAAPASPWNSPRRGGRSDMRRSLSTLAALLAPTIALLTPSAARADAFAAGSLIIPMDTEYQDLGIFEAYGLVYELLRGGVPVRWVIKAGKA